MANAGGQMANAGGQMALWPNQMPHLPPFVPMLNAMKPPSIPVPVTMPVPVPIPVQSPVQPPGQPDRRAPFDGRYAVRPNSATQPAAGFGYGQKYALGDTVYAVRETGVESLGFVKSFDAASMLYTVELETVGSGLLKHVYENGLRPVGNGLRPAGNGLCNTSTQSTAPPPARTPLLPAFPFAPYLSTPRASAGFPMARSTVPPPSNIPPAAPQPQVMGSTDEERARASVESMLAACRATQSVQAVQAQRQSLQAQRPPMQAQRPPMAESSWQTIQAENSWTQWGQQQQGVFAGGHNQPQPSASNMPVGAQQQGVFIGGNGQPQPGASNMLVGAQQQGVFIGGNGQPQPGASNMLVGAQQQGVFIGGNGQPQPGASNMLSASNMPAGVQQQGLFVGDNGQPRPRPSTMLAGVQQQGLFVGGNSQPRPPASNVPVGVHRLFDGGNGQPRPRPSPSTMPAGVQQQQNFLSELKRLQGVMPTTIAEGGASGNASTARADVGDRHDTSPQSARSMPRKTPLSPRSCRKSAGGGSSDEGSALPEMEFMHQLPLSDTEDVLQQMSVADFEAILKGLEAEGGNFQ